MNSTPDTEPDRAEAELRAVLELSAAVDRLTALACAGRPLPPGAAGLLEGISRELTLISEQMAPAADDDDGCCD